MRLRPKQRPQAAEADICLIVEGCYPYVAGGVSSWIDWLIRGNPRLTFSVVAIVAGSEPREARYRLPDNVVGLQDLQLHGDFGSTDWREYGDTASDVGNALSETLIALVRSGGLSAFH